MASFEFQWVQDPVSAWMPGYTAWLNVVHQVIRAELEAMMPEITDWMTVNATFNDRTGWARSQLRAMLEEQLDYLVVTMNYGQGMNVPYAVYIEYDHQGRFAILEPALNYWGPKILQRLQEVLR